jgi:hypothetical protein
MDVNQDLTVCNKVNVSSVAYILVHMTESQDTFGCCQERNVESCNKLPAVHVCYTSDMHCSLLVCLFVQMLEYKLQVSTKTIAR